MPATANPYYGANAAAIEQGIESLGSALFGDPEKAAQLKLRDAQISAYGAGARKDTAEATRKELENQQLGDILANPGLGMYDDAGAVVDNDALRRNATDYLTRMAVAGIDNPDEMLGAVLAYTGNDEMARRGMVGRGVNPSADFALDIGRADQISARDAGEDQTKAFGVANINNSGAMARQLTVNDTNLQKQRLSDAAALDRVLQAPRTLGERMGDSFVTLPAEEQATLTRMKSMGGVTPRNAVVPGADGNDTSTYGIGAFIQTPDGFEVAPAGTRFVGAENMNQGTAGALGLTNSTKTDAQKRHMALNDIDQTIQEVRRIGENEANFGAAGRIRNTVQNLAQQGDALGSMLDQWSSQAQADIAARAATPADQDKLMRYFDPNLPAMDVAMNALAYQYATAIAGNDRISDSDFIQARNAVGDPTAILANRASLNARMDFIQQQANSRRANIEAALRTGQIVPMGTMQPRQSGPAASAFSDIGSMPEVPPDAANDLLADPSPEAQAEFDEIFGSGAARGILQAAGQAVEMDGLGELIDGEE